jgi:carbonic anhydrase
MPISAQKALANLMEGNERFAAGRPASRPAIERVRELARGQSPFATVLACADSRVPVETLFDHEPGEIFVVRLAGNFLSEAALASIEYAVQILKSPLVMVLGHTSCGAVKAAVDFVRTGEALPGHMQVLADAIAPAAQAVRERQGDWWHNAVVENARFTAERVRTAAPILDQVFLRREARVVGAVYDLSTGRVSLVN